MIFPFPNVDLGIAVICVLQNTKKKKKGTALYISSPTNWERRREVSRHRISQFRLLVDIYSTMCISCVRVSVEIKLWQSLKKFIKTAECAIIVIGAIPLTKRMQIFFDTGAKFHEFPLRCGIAEASLIYDNLLNNKRITKQYIC